MPNRIRTNSECRRRYALTATAGYTHAPPIYHTEGTVRYARIRYALYMILRTGRGSARSGAHLHRAERDIVLIARPAHNGGENQRAAPAAGRRHRLRAQGCRRWTRLQAQRIQWLLRSASLHPWRSRVYPVARLTVAHDRPPVLLQATSCGGRRRHRHDASVVRLRNRPPATISDAPNEAGPSQAERPRESENSGRSATAERLRRPSPPGRCLCTPGCPGRRGRQRRSPSQRPDPSGR